jgi:hypothetical protein
MSELKSTQSAADPGQSSKANFLHRQLPYLVVLALAISGVAYTNISHQPLVGYWEFLTLAMGVVCVVTEWAKVDDKQARFQLMWTQALHWGAILVTMNIMLLSGVQQLLPSPATSLVLLMLLALGTFLAGLNLLSLQICFLGLAMAFAVPAMVQAVRALFGLGCCIFDWTWHDLLAARSGQRARHAARRREQLDRFLSQNACFLRQGGPIHPCSSGKIKLPQSKEATIRQQLCS